MKTFLKILAPTFLAIYQLTSASSPCRAGSLRYAFGDALTDNPDCMGPMGKPYPRAAVDRLVPHLDPRGLGINRQGRKMFKSDLNSASFTSEQLMKAYAAVNNNKGFDSFHQTVHRMKREAVTPPTMTTSTARTTNNVTIDSATTNSSASSCPSSLPPSRLCSSTFNTTAPMYGVSLTSGEPVTIVQKFPDLLQQVVFETCTSKTCELVHGECVQTFVPYLFLVIPLGPVTLTGQDYVLVESGCTCQPRYALRNDPDPLAVIPKF